MATSTSGLLAFDRDHLWHPYTSMTDPAPARRVVGASGVRLMLEDGAGERLEVIDAMSSWWAAIHGYRHPIIDAAVHAQLDRFAHVMFGGFTHGPAVGLARLLLDLAPAGLEHVFLADSGSVSVEVALKMALQYQRGRGRPERTRMLTVAGGYHGDTFGAMSVCDPVGGMHTMFTDVLRAQVYADRPPSQDAGEAAVDAWAAGVAELADRHRHELAGIIVEPVLQGAGGMWPYPPDCVRALRRLADQHDLVLILDEIATGFGRTGTMFAADAAGISPDVMCVGKALTGGYLTMAATLCTAEIAHGIAGSDSGVLMHGPTFMANPLACSAGIANLGLLATGTWAEQVRRIGEGLAAGLGPLAQRTGVAEVRTLGAVGVVQLDHPVDVAAATRAALAHGVWLRPFRDLIYTMPPYLVTADEVGAICTAIGAAVDAR